MRKLRLNEQGMTGLGSQTTNHKGRTPSLRIAVISSTLIHLLRSQPLSWAQGTEQRGRWLWWPALTGLLAVHTSYEHPSSTGETQGTGPGMRNNVPYYCPMGTATIVSVISFRPSLDNNFTPAYPQARGTLEHLPLSDAGPLSSVTTGPSLVVQMPPLQMNDLEQMPSEERVQQQQKGSQSLITASLKVVVFAVNESLLGFPLIPGPTLFSVSLGLGLWPHIPYFPGSPTTGWVLMRLSASICCCWLVLLWDWLPTTSHVWFLTLCLPRHCLPAWLPTIRMPLLDTAYYLSVICDLVSSSLFNLRFL